VTKYLVVYEQSKDGWGAYVPDLPGLGVVGDTFEEVQQLITEGIPLHLEALREHGDPIPKPSAKSAYVPVSDQQESA
jgi:predicted RNase H-like HicB family nuclease